MSLLCHLTNAGALHCTGRSLAEWPTFSLAPVITPCLLLPGILLALVLSVLLYRKQRLMAPMSTVLFLTFLRGLLIAMLAILFLQPALKWTQNHTSNGTLWMVVDQSPSMQTLDPQARPGERLHWQEGLGMISSRARPVRPDEIAARLHVLTDELDTIVPDVTASGTQEEIAATHAFATRLGVWDAELISLANAIHTAAGPLDAFSGAGTKAERSLRSAASTVQSSIAHIRTITSVRDAEYAFERFNVARNVKEAGDTLAAAADAADKAFLDANSADGAVKMADARTSKMERQDLALALLTDPDARASKALTDLVKQYHVRIASFSDKTQSAGAVDPDTLAQTLRSAFSPSGQATDIGSALQYVSEQISTDEAASVIIVSDGRNNTGGDPSAPARNLAARGVRVFGLLVGSHEVSPDAAVEQVDAPDWVYKGDAVKARALIRLDGLQGNDVVVELRRGDSVIDRRQIHARDQRQTVPIDFSDTPPDTATALEYTVRVSEVPGEVNLQNNVSTFRVAVKKDKLYALFIEDRPRWEYRYLAANLARDPRLKLQTVLLAPAQIANVQRPQPETASPDNPHEDAQLLPTTAKEWQAFDLIVLGDIGPDTLTPQMQQFIATAVRDRGTTLITIAGERAMPAKFANSPLAEILPVTLEPQWAADVLARQTRAGFRATLAPAASNSVLGQLDADPSGNARVWSNFPLWYWHSPFTQAKPAASVIWAISDNPASAAGLSGAGGTLADLNRHALLSTMSIGLGKSLYLASDQSWRLRQVGGANMHDRFWGQVLRWAVGSDLPAGGKYVRFGASEREYDQTQPVVITARVLRDDLTPYTGLSFSAVAKPVRSAGVASPGNAASTAANAVEARFEPMDSPGYYQATLGGLPIGEVEVTLRGAEVERLLDSDPSVTQRSLLLKILPSMNAERQNMNTDPELLETVAKVGGGYSLDAQYADVLFAHLPKIEHTESSTFQAGFFTDPAATGTRVAHWTFLGLFVALITLEWIVRKRAGLV